MRKKYGPCLFYQCGAIYTKSFALALHPCRGKICLPCIRPAGGGIQGLLAPVPTVGGVGRGEERGRRL